MESQEEMQVMAHALCHALGVRFDPEGGHARAQDGVWFIERAGTRRALYRVACGRGPNGGVDHPLSHRALTVQEMANALYYARRALELKAHYAAGGA